MSDTATYLNWEDLIRFYAEAGVDSALADEPVDQFAQAQIATVKSHVTPQTPSETTVPLAGTPVSASANFDAVKSPSKAHQQASSVNHVPAAAALAPEILLNEARSRAAGAATLDDLLQTMSEFDGCRLKFTAKNICFSDGSPLSELMVIGDAPGRDDDLEGVPFSGPAGQMLNRILVAINLSRDKAYLANTLPWRPPGNRPATPLELDLCRPFLDRQIELVAPKVIVALGDSTAKILTGSREPIYKLRGNWHNYTTNSQVSIAVMPSLHPDYLLRTPAQKRFAWEDWLMVKLRLEQV